MNAGTPCSNGTPPTRFGMSTRPKHAHAKAMKLETKAGMNRRMARRKVRDVSPENSSGYSRLCMRWMKRWDKTKPETTKKTETMAAPENMRRTNGRSQSEVLSWYPQPQLTEG